MHGGDDRCCADALPAVASADANVNASSSVWFRQASCPAGINTIKGVAVTMPQLPDQPGVLLAVTGLCLDTLAHTSGQTQWPLMGDVSGGALGCASGCPCMARHATLQPQLRCLAMGKGVLACAHVYLAI